MEAFGEHFESFLEVFRGSLGVWRYLERYLREAFESALFGESIEAHLGAEMGQVGARMALKIANLLVG